MSDRKYLSNSFAESDEPTISKLFPSPDHRINSSVSGSCTISYVFFTKGLTLVDFLVDAMSKCVVVPQIADPQNS